MLKWLKYYCIMNLNKWVQIITYIHIKRSYNKVEYELIFFTMKLTKELKERFWTVIFLIYFETIDFFFLTQIYLVITTFVSCKNIIPLSLPRSYPKNLIGDKKKKKFKFQYILFFDGFISKKLDKCWESDIITPPLLLFKYILALLNH